jgi:hypothetical protein
MNENYTNTHKIGIIIPTTSNKRNYSKVEDIDFFKTFMKNFISHINNNYNYTIYLGYDDDDKFYNQNLQQVEEYFDQITEGHNVNLKFVVIQGFKGRLGKIWSLLAQEAVKDNCDYLYQIGDDVEILTSGWEDKFINKLQELDNVGVVGPLDLGNGSILTQSFVHKTHLDIFENYYPNELVNWHIDDWITEVYKPNNSFIMEEIKVKNLVNNRYNVVSGKKIYKKLLKRDMNLINKYLSVEGFEDLVYQKVLYNGRGRVQNYINNN